MEASTGPPSKTRTAWAHEGQRSAVRSAKSEPMTSSAALAAMMRWF